MTKSIVRVALALALFGFPTLAFADSSCVAQATDKKLAGAAKTSFMKKCDADAADFLRQAGGRQEAGRGRENQLHQEVRRRRDGRVTRRFKSSLPGGASAARRAFAAGRRKR